MRISDWSSDVCSSDLRICAHWPLDLRQRPFHPLGIGGGRIGDQQGLWPGAHFRPRLGLHRQADPDLMPVRSEERRVWKECVRTVRSRWSPYHYKTKTTKHHITRAGDTYSVTNY